MSFNSLKECEAELLKFVPPPKSQRQKYDLTRIKAFMNYLGNPQNNYQVIHVAGTSGKTSTCYYLSGLCYNSGLKVGLSVSPHITSVNERVQINNVPAGPKIFASELAVFIDLVSDSKIELTYFEVLIAFAYWFFDRQKVDIAVIETGLGGLLDGSNVVTKPEKVCVLTDIGLDHTAILGNTISKIAAQKAGIIKLGNTVFTMNQGPVVNSVFNKSANKAGAKIQVISTGEYSYKTTSLPLFQQRNLGLAVSVVNWLLKSRYGATALPDSTIEQVAKTKIPARMELVKINDKTIVMDGAHNPQKLEFFVKSFRELMPVTSNITVLFACIEGPDFKIEHNIEQMLKLKPKKIILTSFKALQDMKKVSVDPKLMAQNIKIAGFSGEVGIIYDAIKALEEALNGSAEQVVITGSLYLIFEIRNQLISLANRQ